MDTWEMIQVIRGQLMEFDERPIDNDLIMRNMRSAYTLIYTRMVKCNDSKYGVKVVFQLKAQTSEYDMPKDAWGKRIEQMVVPYPPVNSDTPIGYMEIEKVDFKETHKYNIPRIKTWLPEVWSTLNNKIYIYPSPLTDSKAYLVISREMVQLGIAQGRIIGITGNKLTLDGLNNDQLAENLTKPLANVISVSDFRTGEVKALYAYTEVDGTEITLGSSTRTSYLGKKITQIYSGNITKVEYDQTTKKCRLYLLSTVANVSAGDYVAVEFEALFGQGYVSEFYANFNGSIGTDIRDNPNENPPDVTFSANPFGSEVYPINAIGTNYIEINTPSFTPKMVDGYWSPTPADPSVQHACYVLADDYYDLTLSLGGLAPFAGNSYTAVVSSSFGDLNAFSIQVVVKDDTTVQTEYMLPKKGASFYDQISIPSLGFAAGITTNPATYTGTGRRIKDTSGNTAGYLSFLPLRVSFSDARSTSGAISPIQYLEMSIEATGTSNIYTLSKAIDARYSLVNVTKVDTSVTPLTGIPGILSYSLSLSPQVICSYHKNAPAVFAFKYPKATDEYDPVNNIEVDDVVTYGYSTGVSLFGTEYDEFIVNHCVLKIRSALNENDPEIVNAIKENMKDLGSDTAGRVMGVHIQRDFSRGASYTRPGRR